MYTSGGATTRWTAMDRPIEGYSIVIGCFSNRLPLRYKACQYRHIGCALRLAAGD
jgi:hypothetical protein